MKKESESLIFTGLEIPRDYNMSMEDIMKQISPALRTETKRIAAGTAICTVLMCAVFLILHLVIPQKVPFDYTVILGGFAGGAVAAGNFFLMGLAVQKVSSMEDQKQAYNVMRASYTQRMLIMVVWGAIALMVPCFNGPASIIPLLFPNIVIKIYYLIIGKNKSSTNLTKEGSEQ